MPLMMRVIFTTHRIFYRCLLSLLTSTLPRQEFMQHYGDGRDASTEVIPGGGCYNTLAKKSIRRKLTIRVKILFSVATATHKTIRMIRKKRYNIYST